uniref:Uncharacterized protein n=1 Tax=Sarcoptes scabiei TaxID=52283 RepID=A0A834VFE8_SARSC
MSALRILGFEGGAKYKQLASLPTLTTKEEIVNAEDNVAENNAELSDLKEDASAHSSIKPNSYAQAVTSTPIPKENFDQTNQLKTIIIKAPSNPDIVTPSMIYVNFEKNINESKTTAQILNMKTTKASVMINSAENDNARIESLIEKINDNNPSMTTALRHTRPRRKTILLLLLMGSTSETILLI